MTDIITAKRLRKRFGELVAVDGIDFSVAEGECFGLLGPNGAGKTSTIRMITCVFDLEATRRENLELQEMVAQLQRVLEGHGYYAEEGVELIADGDQLPEGEGGLIDLPDIGDFIHNNECEHPYDTNCWCEHCEACRIRMQQHGDGAD